MTNDGEYSYDGHYNEDTIGSEWRRSDTQVRLYAYSNAAYAMAETLKSKATVYSVGLFNDGKYAGRRFRNCTIFQIVFFRISYIIRTFL